MFELLSEYIGMQHITLLCGEPPKDDDSEYLLAVVNYGMTAESSPRNFFQFNPDRFKKDVFGTFMEYLQATKGEFERHLDQSITDIERTRGMEAAVRGCCACYGRPSVSRA